ncbi:MAG TPA: DUF1801 domain-containing protein [Longimicrobium sp.]|jgi:hypothetical protein
MVQIAAATPEEYLRSLPEDRREVVAAVRDVIVRNLPDGYRETASWGMLAYCVPLERFPNTYNKQPLAYVGLASQKNHIALYMMGAYGDPAHARLIEEGFARAGKKLDMGKSCIRFRKLDDLPLDVIGEAVARMPPEELMALHDAAHPPKPKKPRSA